MVNIRAPFVYGEEADACCCSILVILIIERPQSCLSKILVWRAINSLELLFILVHIDERKYRNRSCVVNILCCARDNIYSVSKLAGNLLSSGNERVHTHPMPSSNLVIMMNKQFKVAETNTLCEITLRSVTCEAENTKP